MPQENNVSKFVQKVLEGLPKDLSHLRAELEKNCRAALSILLERMDLVTREEFDIQLRLQQRLRETLDELQQRVTTLESQGAKNQKDKRKRAPPGKQNPD